MSPPVRLAREPWRETSLQTRGATSLRRALPALSVCLTRALHRYRILLHPGFRRVQRPPRANSNVSPSLHRSTSLLLAVVHIDPHHLARVLPLAGHEVEIRRCLRSTRVPPLQGRRPPLAARMVGSRRELTPRPRQAVGGPVSARRRPSARPLQGAGLHHLLRRWRRVRGGRAAATALRRPPVGGRVWLETLVAVVAVSGHVPPRRVGDELVLRQVKIRSVGVIGEHIWPTARREYGSVTERSLTCHQVHQRR